MCWRAASPAMPGVLAGGTLTVSLSGQAKGVQDFRREQEVVQFGGLRSRRARSAAAARRSSRPGSATPAARLVASGGQADCFQRRRGDERPCPHLGRAHDDLLRWRGQQVGGQQLGGSELIASSGVASERHPQRAGGLLTDKGSAVIGGGSVFAGTLAGYGALTETGGGSSGAQWRWHSGFSRPGGDQRWGDRVGQRQCAGDRQGPVRRRRLGNPARSMRRTPRRRAGPSPTRSPTSVGANDFIDLRSIAFVSGATASVSGSTLVLTDGGNTYKFKLAGSIAAIVSGAERWLGRHPDRSTRRGRNGLRP